MIEVGRTFKWQKFPYQMMAAHTDTVAWSSDYSFTFMLVNSGVYYFTQSWHTPGQQRWTFATKWSISPVCGVPESSGDSQITGDTCSSAPRCEQREKRGKWGGVGTRLKASPLKPPLPTIFLSNARSIHNKLDEVRIATQRTIDHCSWLIFSETWLDSSIPNAAIKQAGRTSYWANRAADSGKKTGGGLCIYINNLWSTNITEIEKMCSLGTELLLLKCRPFNLPREFSVVYICTTSHLMLIPSKR